MVIRIMVIYIYTLCLSLTIFASTDTVLDIQIGCCMMLYVDMDLHRWNCLQPKTMSRHVRKQSPPVVFHGASKLVPQGTAKATCASWLLAMLPPWGSDFRTCWRQANIESFALHPTGKGTHSWEWHDSSAEWLRSNPGDFWCFLTCWTMWGCVPVVLLSGGLSILGKHDVLGLPLAQAPELSLCCLCRARFHGRRATWVGVFGDKVGVFFWAVTLIGKDGKIYNPKTFLEHDAAVPSVET